MIADVNRILAEQTLARHFDLIIFIVNQYGEEKCQTYKETKKKFLSSFNNNSSFRVKLVETYPTEMVNDIFYIAKSGKTVWIKGQVKEEICNGKNKNYR